MLRSGSGSRKFAERMGELVHAAWSDTERKANLVVISLSASWLFRQSSGTYFGSKDRR